MVRLCRMGHKRVVPSGTERQGRAMLRAERAEGAVPSAAGAMLLSAHGAASAPETPSVGLRPAGRVEQADGTAFRVRMKALSDEGDLALLGRTELMVGETVHVTIAAGLRFAAIVRERHDDHVVVCPRDAQNQRRAQRRTVNRTGCRLVLANGVEAECDVVDVSATGLFVRTDAPLAVGEVVRIGCTKGRVVRADADGFGISVEPQKRASDARPSLRAV